MLALVGFNWGGWVTTGTAEALAKESATNAVAERLGSICVAQFNKNSEKTQKLNEMKAQDTWERGRYIEKQSWAIMPGDDKPDRRSPMPAQAFYKTALIERWPNHSVHNRLGAKAIRDAFRFGKEISPSRIV